jgi:hypothetical protein
MNRSVLRFGLGSCCALLLAACIHPHTQVDRSAHVKQMTHIFVEHRLADGRGLDLVIVAELQRLGYDASAGPMTMMPDNTDAILAYEDVWTFDFTTYLLELDIAVRDARTGKQIAVTRYSHPSIFGTNPVSIVAKVVDPIFKRP